MTNLNVFPAKFNPIKQKNLQSLYFNFQRRTCKAETFAVFAENFGWITVTLVTQNSVFCINSSIHSVSNIAVVGVAMVA